MKRRTITGFSLVELLVVIGVIALLATIGTIAATSFARKAKQQKTYAYMDLLMGAILTFQESTGNYPNPNTDAWQQANDNANCLYNILKNEPAAFDKVKQMPTDAFILNSGGQAYGFKDGWGNPLYYNARGGMGGTPALWSAGADGVGCDTQVRSSSYKVNAGENSAAKDDVYSYRK